MNPSRHPLASTLAFGAVLLIASACGGDDPAAPPPPPPPPENRAPQPVDSIGELVLVVGIEVSTRVSQYFSDPDGDALSYGATSSDAGVATASARGAEVVVTGVAPGTATVTITASDPGGLSATQTMPVKVEALNLPPTIVGQVDDRNLAVGDTLELDAAPLFSDPEGESLVYRAVARDSSVATAVVAGSMVTVAAVGVGATMVGIEATDAGGASAALEFAVMVAAAGRAPTISDSIPAQELTVGDTVAVEASDHFSDPDGDALTYTVASSDEDVAAAMAAGDLVTIVALSPGSTAVRVTATDPDEMWVHQDVAVTVVASAPGIVDTIPTHDVLVDSAVSLDLGAYFEGDGLSYAASTSDESVATSSVEGGAITTLGVGVVEGETVSTATLAVTATGASGESVRQDSIKVRVHEEPYDTLPGLGVLPDGRLRFSGLTLGGCLRLAGFPVPGQDQLITVHWSEWQRAVDGGWITVQENEKHNTLSGSGNSICPINLEDERFPAGRYRLIGHVQLGDESDHYRTTTVEKSP